jgi:tripartite-type tricarboxylate transporter receptor subunit TctC
MVAGLALSASAASAQTFPSQPITLVVPFAAGGPTDTVGRLVAQSMSKNLGQQIIVENVGGAGGTLGGRRVAQADPDGYTVLLHNISMATVGAMYRDPPYDVLTDFEMIGLVTEVPMTLIGRPDLEPTTLPELVEWIRERGTDVMYGHAGLGVSSHMCMLLFSQAAGVEMTDVPYQGTAPVMSDLLGSQVDLLCDQTTNTTAQIRDGAVRAYAVTSPERLPTLPDLPTAREGGLDDFGITIWHGLYAPAGTPAEIVEALAASLREGLQDPTLIARFNDLGTTPSSQEDATGEALRARLESEIDLWHPILEAIGIQAN